MIQTIAGVAGSLRWGYHAAASLTEWTVTKTDDGWSLTATVVSSDAFRVAQRPIVFEAIHAHGVWRWPALELQMTGVALTARLSPMEKQT